MYEYDHVLLLVHVEIPAREVPVHVCGVTEVAGSHGTTYMPFTNRSKLWANNIVTNSGTEHAHSTKKCSFPYQSPGAASSDWYKYRSLLHSYTLG